ncbi:hypothetical protein R1sor_015728 [Riccia sorocarpa]|uniref:Reverse transcriptase domain-containing protein n=1 Tax=Riccia sorocarpa TaxID=122646 RepID=A0ABD3HJ58_9MARC
MLADLKIISWNIHGLGNVDRVRSAKQWLTREQKDAKVLALQELKAQEENLHFNLMNIWENAKVVVDYSTSGRGGAALVIHPSCQVVEGGIKGDGTCAWAKILTEAGPVNVMSIYAPNNARERRGLWIWLEEKLNEENWLLAGDWNSVELPDDSDGPTAVLHGGDLRVWKSLTNGYELVDSYLCATFNEGPRFTRQVVCGDRFDQARLDRVYLSNGGSWIHHVHKVSHEARQTLSGHWPVVVTLTVTEQSQEKIQRGTYFKMSAEDLKNKEIFEGVKKTWETHPEGVLDPQARWILAWDRVRTFLKNWKSRIKRREDPLSQKRQELYAVRMRIQTDREPGLKDRILTLEKEIRKREMADARCWRLRSRVRWMAAGEAPSHYFFAQLKSKHARETIQSLRLENGAETRNESEIRDAITQYFQKQFKEPPVDAQAQRLRGEILALIDRTVSQDQNRELIARPSEEEVDKLVEDLPRDKAPGLDGVTNNMIQDCWTFIRTDCQNLLWCFWRTGELMEKSSQGAIKLLPKNDEKWNLKNWRPITLMGITYKLIGKLLANRLKKVVGFLTSPQQSGFIEGRSIFDNLLSSRMGADWAQESKQKAIFLKLDFAKAYDRVQHTYIWETLEAMKIEPHFIKLLRGLKGGENRGNKNTWRPAATPPIVRG